MAVYTYAGRYGPENVIDQSSGRPIPGAVVEVFLRGTGTRASLYLDRTKALSQVNPTAADQRGNLTFFADPGEYDILVNGATLPVTVPIDPAEAAQDVTTGASAAEILIGHKVAGDAFNRFEASAAGVLRWGSGSAAPDVNLYRSAADTLKTDDSLHVFSPTAASVASIIRGAAAQSTDLQQWQNSAGAVLARISAAGAIGVGAAPPNNVKIFAEGLATAAAAVYPVTHAIARIRSANTNVVLDTGAINAPPWNVWQQVGDSNGPTVYPLILQPLGSDVGIGLSSTATPASRLHVLSTIASRVGLVVQGAAGQSVNLQEWQDSAAAVLLRVDSIGAIHGSAVWLQRAAGLGALGIQQPGDLNQRLRLTTDGTILFGDGSSEPDTNLYRADANVLATNDPLRLLSASAGVGHADRAAELQLRNMNSTNNNYTLIGHDVSTGLIGAAIAFRTLDHASRRSRIEFQGHDGATFYGPLGMFETTIADTETALLVRRNIGGVFTLQRVSQGAVDSGSAGFRLLRVAN